MKQKVHKQNPGWLLLAAFLFVLLTWSASAQTNFFNDGLSTAAGDDGYPGFAGDDTVNTPGTGWSSQWSIDASSANRTQLTGFQVITTSPLNGGGNYLNWYSWNPGDSGGGVSLYRLINTNIPVATTAAPLTGAWADVTLPYVVEFDWRLDQHLEDVTGHSNSVSDFGVTNGGGSKSSTAFSGTQDQFQWFNCDTPTSADSRNSSGYWVVLRASSTSKGNSLTNRAFGFYEAGLTAASENHGRYWNATNIGNNNYIATNNIYHFKFVTDPLNYTWEGFLTNVTLGVGWSSTTMAGHKLRSRGGVPYQQPWWPATPVAPILNSSHTNILTVLEWEARSQNGVSNLSGSMAGWCPTNFISMDNLTVYNLPTNQFPPVLGTNFFPHIMHTFYPASSNFNFSASTYVPGKTLPHTGFVLTLNGVNVSAGLTFTGTDSSTSRTATYSGLLDNTIYQAGFSVADSAGIVTSNFFTFDTFNTNSAIVIETENYNFDPTLPSLIPGQTDTTQTDRFIQNWVYSGLSSDGSTVINPTNGYIGRPADFGIDYYYTVASSGNGDSEGPFRPSEAGKIATFGGGTTTGNFGSGVVVNVDDDVRKLYLDFNDSGMMEVDTEKVGTNDWWNYTHIWPTNNYIAYLRGGAYNTKTVVSPVLTLSQVIENGTSSYTNNTTTGGIQQSNVLGKFTIPIGSGIFGITNTNIDPGVVGVMTDQPLLDTNGYSRVLKLGGKLTLKLACTAGDTVANDSCWLNYMVFVPVPNIVVSNATMISSSDYRFAFNSITNVHYTIQTNSVLTGALPWATLTTKIGTGGSVTVDDTSGSGGNLFYRVTTP